MSRCVFRLWGVFLLVASVLFCVQAQAARSVTVDQPLIVRLEQNQFASIVYPESIQKVIVGWDEKTLQPDHVGPYLYLMPLFPELSGRFYVVGESGRQYIGTFKTATPSDDVVFVTVPTAATTKAVPFTPTSLLRRLRQADAKPLPGETSLALPVPLMDDVRLAVVSMTAIRVGAWVGMTLTLRTTQSVPLVLDIRKGVPVSAAEDVVSLNAVVWPPLWEPHLLAAESEQLMPGVETRVYIVLQQKEAQGVH